MAKSEKTVRSSELKALLSQLRAAADDAGIKLDIGMRGSIPVGDLGLDIGIKNADCNGSCSTNCSGCSACSGCSGCSDTSTVKGFSWDEYINPDPISRFLTDLRNPAVQAILETAAVQAGGGK